MEEGEEEEENEDEQSQMQDEEDEEEGAHLKIKRKGSIMSPVKPMRDHFGEKGSLIRDTRTR